MGSCGPRSRGKVGRRTDGPINLRGVGIRRRVGLVGEGSGAPTGRSTSVTLESVGESIWLANRPAAAAAAEYLSKTWSLVSISDVGGKPGLIYCRV